MRFYTLVSFFFIGFFTFNVLAETVVDTKLLDKKCDEEVAKEHPNKKVFLGACAIAGNQHEQQRNYNSASWYYLLGGEFRRNITVVKPLITANYAHSNIAYSHVLLPDNKENIKATFHKYLQQSPIDIADETLRGDYKILLKLFPARKAALDKALIIWSSLNESLKPIFSLKKQYKTVVVEKNLIKAIDLLKKIHSLEEKLLNKSNPSRLETQLALGISFNQNKQYSESIEVFSDIESIYKMLPNEQINFAKVLHWTAAGYQQLNQLAKAKIYYEKTVLVKENLLENNHIELASIYRDVAAFFEARKDQTNSLVYYEKLLNIYIKNGYAEEMSISPLYDKLAVLYSAVNQYQKAINVRLQSLAIREKNLGEEHLDTSTTINNLAIDYANIGDNKKALELYQRALVIREKLLKPEDELIAQSYNNIGSAFSDLNNLNQAIDYYKKALVINQKVLGMEHSETAINNSNLALAYKKAGNYAQSLKLQKHAIKVKEVTFGADKVETAVSYNELGSLYMAMSEYQKAMKYYNKALVIQEKVLGKTHDVTATTYNNIGHAQQALGQYDNALKYYEKALRINIQVFGEEDPKTATALASLASLYEQRADYPKALGYFNKALKIRKKVLGEEHPETATSYNNLGAFYVVQGDIPSALENYKKCLVIRQKVLGAEHPLTAQINNNMGSAYSAVGDYTKALKLYKVALKINEKKLGKNNIETATNYNNIGIAYQSLDDIPRALEYVSKALDITIKVLGEDQPQVATSLNNMGLLAVDTRDYPKALEYYQKALKIREKLFGFDHPATASSYGALAVLYGFMGENEKSLKFYEKTLKIRQAVFGDEHIDVSDTYSNMAIVYWAMDDAPNYYKSIKKSFDIFLKNRDQVFSVLDSQQKNKYLKYNRQKIAFLLDATDKSLFTFLGNPKDRNKNIKKAKALLGDTVNDWLNYKGSVFDSENAIAMLYEKTKDPEIKHKIDQLVKAKRALAKLYQSIPKRKERKAWSNKITQIKKQLDTLSSDIAEKASDFKSEQGLSVIKARDIARRLNKQTLYIDYMKSENHYYLFTLDNQENVNFVKFDASSTVKIDKLVQSFRNDIARILDAGSLSKQKMSELTKSSKEKLSQLYKMLLSDPIGMQIKDKKSLILSADGALRLLPFEALFNEENKRYLIEDKTVRYIPSGKELVRLFQLSDRKQADDKGMQRQAIVFANPSFDKVLGDNETLKKKDKNPLSVSASRAGIIKSLFKMRFNQLPGTKAEAEAIKEMLQDEGVTEYLREEATEDNLIKVDNPKILHIATHGFFLNDDTIPNPMLKSGVALAGANASAIKGKSGGIVTALKLSGLSLKDTELVVLSACETGVVDVDSTESVSGLSKAFIQAGAKNIVMSLWSVADKETMQLMKGFYGEVKRKKDYSEALRVSKLQMIKKELHPFYWAAFIISGTSGLDAN